MNNFKDQLIEINDKTTNILGWLNICKDKITPDLRQSLDTINKQLDIITNGLELVGCDEIPF